MPKHRVPSPQPSLFDLAPEPDEQEPTVADEPTPDKSRAMSVFANDEVANSITFLPQAASFPTLEDFRNYLAQKLPYNAAETRHRRANYIIERLYPEGEIETPLSYFSARCSTPADLGPVVFYHLLRAEPLAASVAEELVWPALPIGRLARDQVQEFVLRQLPEVKLATLQKTLQALSHTYSLTGVGEADGEAFRFHLHSGTFESFLYILTSEYPQPGIYTFDSLYTGPLHRWLLWDREWMRLQLYNLQDLGILAKVSEIDTVRQFTLALDQPAALRRFYEHPTRRLLAVREAAPDGTAEEQPDASA